VKLDSYDVNLRIEWTKKGAKEGETKCVVAKEKMSEDEGSLEVEGEGELKLIFDNTYSYLTSKDVRFAVYFHPDSEDGAENKPEGKAT